MKKPFREEPEFPFDPFFGLDSTSIRKTCFPALKRFRALLEKSSDGIILSEQPEGRITDMNKTAREFLGGVSSDSVFDLFKDVREIRDIFAGNKDKIGFLYRVESSEGPLRLDVAGRLVKFEDKNFLVLVIHDVTERETLLERIEDSLKEKEVLLKEINHRVKNNLQIVSSLLSLYEHSVHRDDGTSFLNDMKARIHAMALVHEQLYQSKEIHCIRLKQYVEELSSHLFDLQPIRNSLIRVELDIDDISVSVEIAIPVGLLLNELFTNSYKHGFAGRRSGRIGIRMRKNGGTLLLIFVNDGEPFPSYFSPRSSRTLGMTLVCTLVDQLQGAMDFDGSEGARYVVAVPLDLREEEDVAGAPR